MDILVRAEITESFVDVGDLRLWTIVQGRGVPLVLCSGGPGCCDYLEPLAGMFDDLCEVIRFDHRGCGRSDKVWLGHEELLQGFLRESVKKFAHST